MTKRSVTDIEQSQGTNPRVTPAQQRSARWIPPWMPGTSSFDRQGNRNCAVPLMEALRRQLCDTQLVERMIIVTGSNLPAPTVMPLPLTTCWHYTDHRLALTRVPVQVCEAGAVSERGR
ncbi:hypothetical protein GCM10027261_19220 [Geodermatophilus arenarius]